MKANFQITCRKQGLLNFHVPNWNLIGDIKGYNVKIKYIENIYEGVSTIFFE